MVRRLTHPFRGVATAPAGSSSLEVHLFDLPASLRRQIWDELSRHDATFSLATQALERDKTDSSILELDRASVLDSQHDLASLFGGIDEAEGKALPTVAFTSQESVDLPASNTQAYVSWPTLLCFELDKSATDQITQILSRLPRVTDLALFKAQTVRSIFYDNLYISVLQQVSDSMTHLTSITLHSNEDSLGFIKTLTSLKKLLFTGYCKDSPMELSSILSRLKHLEELEIIPPVTPAVSEGSSPMVSPPKKQALTREVIRDLRGLKAFTLRERKNHRPQQPVFCTAQFVQAVASGHKTSLQRLRIDLDFTPDTSSQLALRRLCQTSSLEHLAVVWPGLRGDVLHILPRSLVSLRTTLPLDRPPYWILQALRWKRSSLPNLKTVCLFGDRETSTLSSVATSTIAFQFAKSRLAELGVQVLIEPLAVA